jgi:hypothetical protein
MTFTFSRLAAQLACDFSINGIATSSSNTYDTEYILHHLCLHGTLIALAPPKVPQQPWHTVIHPPTLPQITQHHTDPPGKRNTSLAFFTAHERNELNAPDSRLLPPLRLLPTLPPTLPRPGLVSQPRPPLLPRMRHQQSARAEQGIETFEERGGAEEVGG